MRSIRYILSIAGVGLLLGMPACSRDEVMGPALEGKVARSESLTPSQIRDLTAQYSEERRVKDEGMLHSPNSPLADALKVGFRGLRYFPVDLRYRFQGPIHRYAKPERFQIMATDGELREAVRWGYFKFTIDGRQIQTLQVYKMLDLDAAHSSYLFLPFADSQAGSVTYGAGRYLDIEENKEGIYIVDFNTAYNPFCAYGKSYSCPMTPRENRLRIPIPAGEKLLSTSD